MLRGFLHGIGVSVVAIVAIAALSVGIDSIVSEIAYMRPDTAQAALQTASSTPTEATSSPSTVPAQKAIVKAKSAASANTATAKESEVRRIPSPYTYPAKTSDELNDLTRKALVNIYCEAGWPLNSISGSGIIVDPRGVILTNAHVAQYVLLSTAGSVNLTCTIRNGSPALAHWKAEILHMPASWVRDHAIDISKSRPKGTGEDDYALLLITKSADATPLPTNFPYLPIDTREAIGFTGDNVFLAAYPAEFAGGGSTRSSLYPSTVASHVGELLTFSENSIDLISVGNVVLAQSGSSGGAVVNAWGHLIGVISTTSDGATTAQRELRAITLSYIDHDLRTETGSSLHNILAEDVLSLSATFMRNSAPQLAQQIVNALKEH